MFFALRIPRSLIVPAAARDRSGPRIEFSVLECSICRCLGGFEFPAGSDLKSLAFLWVVLFSLERFCASASSLCCLQGLCHHIERFSFPVVYLE